MSLTLAATPRTPRVIVTASRSPLHVEVRHAADPTISVHRQRFAVDSKLRNAGRKCREPLLQFRLGERFSEAAVRTAAEHHMPAWRIGPPDVEAIRLGACRWITHR